MRGKLSGILLLFCLVAPVSTTYFLLQHQKKQLRREVKWKLIAGIDKEELALLKFTKAEVKTKLRWEHSKEFEFDNHMYDVVEKEQFGDTIYYWCWPDKAETKLNKRLDKLFYQALGNDRQKKQNQERLTGFYKSLFYGKSILQQNCPIATHLKLKGHMPGNYFSLSYPPPIPPPRMG